MVSFGYSASLGECSGSPLNSLDLSVRSESFLPSSTLKWPLPNPEQLLIYIGHLGDKLVEGLGEFLISKGFRDASVIY